MDFPSAGKGKLSFLPKKSTPTLHIDRTVLNQACSVCSMYNVCLETLTQMASDILVGLGCSGTLVTKLWYFLTGVVGLDVDRAVQRLGSKDGGELGSILTFFSQITQYLLA